MAEKNITITEEELWRGLSKLEEKLELLKSAEKVEKENIGPQENKAINDKRKEADKKDDEVNKSVDTDNSDETPTGIEVSDFLMELAETFRKGMDEYKEGLVSMITSGHEAQGEIVKSIAEYTKGSEEILCKSVDALNSAWDMPARGPKSVTGVDGDNVQRKSLSPAQQIERKHAQIAQLQDMVKGGNATMLDLVRFEKSGELSYELAKSLNN